jgi:hypothetical protein
LVHDDPAPGVRRGAAAATPATETTMNTRIAPLLLSSACILAGCDTSRLAAPTSEPAQFSAVAGSPSFGESFDRGALQSTDRLEVSTALPLEWGYYSLPDYSSGAAVFGGNADGLRTYLRTTGAGYNDVDFVADVTVTVAGEGGLGIAFIGLGTGTTNECEFYCEPTGNPAVYARIFPDSFGGGSAITDHTTAGIMEGANSGVGGSGTHRVRMSWKASSGELSVAIHEDYQDGADFAATTTMTRTVDASVFDGNGRIFFGGAGNASFDNVRVTAMPRR